MKKIKCILNEVKTFFETLLLMAIPLMITAHFLLILQPMWPITTLLFVALVTKLSMSNKYTGLLSLTGIAIYASSWFVAKQAGMSIGIIVCGLGIITWMYAAYLSAIHHIEYFKRIKSLMTS